MQPRNASFRVEVPAGMIGPSASLRESTVMHVVALSGSPSLSSRSSSLLRHALTRVDAAASRSEIVIRALPAHALLGADTGDAQIRAAREAIDAARFVVVSTPIYKASYSGLLKVFLDLLAPDALRGKTVLALGTGGSPAHLLALDYALKPVLAALGARHLLDAVYATDAQVVPDGAGGHVVDVSITARIDRALAEAPAGVPLREAAPMPVPVPVRAAA
jgi:FMN reductase